MFKQRGLADELAESMRREMLVKEAEAHSHSDKLKNAVECLDRAAELFDDLGMEKTAETITHILEKIAGQ